MTMHLKNQPPVFVPHECRAEIEKLSKAALMDIAWDYALQLSGAGEFDADTIMSELRKRIDLIQTYRKQEKEG
jgi:hypothetical protein